MLDALADWRPEAMSPKHLAQGGHFEIDCARAFSLAQTLSLEFSDVAMVDIRHKPVAKML
jgi:hypothetical protein